MSEIRAIPANPILICPVCDAVVEIPENPAIVPECSKCGMRYGTLPNRPKDHINPSHYQGYLILDDKEIQWLEAMCRIQRYRNNPEVFIGAIELQVRKYLDRNGRKDEELQELLKGLWYYKFMCAYIKNGCKPILVSEVEEILARK